MTIKQTKADLLNQKIEIDRNLAKKKAELAAAKQTARMYSRFMVPENYGQLELDISLLSQRSQAIQAKLAKLKQDRTANINDCFRDAACRYLPPDTFKAIMDMAFAIQQERSNAHADQRAAQEKLEK